MSVCHLPEVNKDPSLKLAPQNGVARWGTRGMGLRARELRNDKNDAVMAILGLNEIGNGPGQSTCEGGP